MLRQTSRRGNVWWIRSRRANLRGAIAAATIASLPFFQMASASASTIGSAGWSATAAQYAKVGHLNVPDLGAIAAVEALQPELPVGDLPTKFVDVAAGPATLALQVALRLAGAAAVNTDGSSSVVGSSVAEIIVTDYAAGMIEAAKKRVEGLIACGTIPADAFKWSFDVVGVEELTSASSVVAAVEGAVTHLGCMFSLNMFADKHAALRQMHKVLVKDGRAVIGTWKSTGAADVVDAFGQWLGVPSDSPSRLQALQMLSSTSDPVQLQSDMEAADFKDVTVTQTPILYRFPDHKGFMNMVLSNPAMSLCLKDRPRPGISAAAEPSSGSAAAVDDAEAVQSAWATFLSAGNPGHKYMVDGRDLELEWVANIAVAIKA